MSASNAPLEQVHDNSLNYTLACELGYELSRQEYYDMLNYAKLVQKEYSMAMETSQRRKRQTKTVDRPSLYSIDSRDPNLKRQIYSEDLWIKLLRQYFESEMNGLDTPVYDTIKARELQVQNEIRKRRLESLHKHPILPKDYKKIIENSLSSFDSMEIILKFCIPITVRDLKTLRPPNWLNDEVINFYFELLRQRSKENSNYPRLHIFNTFFYPKLKSNGYDSIKRWTKKVDIFSFDMILVPIHLGVHWCCAEINLKERSIRYFDSLHNSNKTCLKLLHEYLIEEHKDKKGCDGNAEFDFENWTLSSPKNIPCQQNGYDCGVFTCIFAEYRSRDADFTFSQKNMNYFRDKISCEIIKGAVL